MQTLDVIPGLHSHIGFSQPLSRLYQAMQIQGKSFLLFKEFIVVATVCIVQFHSIFSLFSLYSNCTYCKLPLIHSPTYKCSQLQVHLPLKKKYYQYTLCISQSVEDIFQLDTQHGQHILYSREYLCIASHNIYSNEKCAMPEHDMSSSRRVMSNRRAGVCNCSPV